jgi:hypothetical protein
MGRIWLCTREDVKGALDSAETARNNAQVDRAVDGASRSVEGYLHREFRPTLATKYFDWPGEQRPRPWRLWIEGRAQLVELDAVTAGGVAIPTGNVFLEPANYGPPYDRVEIDLGTTSAFSSAATHQRAIAFTGLWGYSNDEEQVGSLAADLAADANAAPSITWTTADIGVGDVLRIGDERMIVSARSMVDTTQNLQTAIGASTADVTVAVASGAAFTPGEVVLLDSERMLVVDVAGNNLTVKRAWDGSVLAAHTGSGIYSLTGVDVDRAQLGTVLAAHSSGAAIYRHLVPGLVRELATAEALDTLLQQQSGYARRQRSGDAAQEDGGRGLPDLRDQARRRFGRKARTGAI